MRIPRQYTVAMALSLALAACGGAEGVTADEPVELRLGHFPNLTHATAIYGLETGIMAETLGPDVDLSVRVFNAGPEAVEALFTDALDASYIGPNPAINAHAQSEGAAIRIVSGATSGGAFLVVREGIESVDDLRGRTLGTPQLGNTQDVALRAWLADEGLASDLEGGGDVSIAPMPNSQILDTFRLGEIDGGWVPEPWATRLVEEAGGQILVDERDLWPEGRYVTTHLIVRTAFMESHPDVVRDLLRAQVQANRALNDEPVEAQGVVNDALENLTDARLSESVLTTAWENLTFTNDPIASSLRESAADAEEQGLLEPVDLDGIYALELLNEVLAAEGLEPVTE